MFLLVGILALLLIYFLYYRKSEYYNTERSVYTLKRCLLHIAKSASHNHYI